VLVGIENAKAKAAAYAKVIADGKEFVSSDEAASASAAPAAAAPVAASATPSAVPAGISAPPEPEMIEITDSMSPEEKRSAKLTNTKAKSAFKKELKALGIDPKAYYAAKDAPAAEATSSAPVADAAPAVPAGVTLPPMPEMIEITDDMSPEEKRSAKLTNTKAKSAYKKELKAMGIDPKTVKF